MAPMADAITYNEVEYKLDQLTERLDALRGFL